MTSLPPLDPALVHAGRTALALLLWAAALHKLRAPARFRAALLGYGIVPRHWLPAAGALLAALEVALGTALLLPSAGAFAARGAALLLGAYGLAIAASLARGRRGVDCGCGFSPAPAPLGWGLVARNAGLALAALALAGPPAERALTWLDGVSMAGAVACAALLQLGVEHALANARSLRAAREAAWSTR